MSDNGDNAQAIWAQFCLVHPHTCNLVFLDWITRSITSSSQPNGNGPSYIQSFLGGMLTFEYMNDAFGDKDTAAAFVPGDAIFMAFFGGMTFLGARSLIGDDSLENGSTTW